MSKRRTKTKSPNRTPTRDLAGGPQQTAKAAPVSPREDVAAALGPDNRGTPSAAAPQAVAAVVLTALFLWAYWPTLAGLVHTWHSEPDYSHGFLLVPLAGYILWVRRERFPTSAGQFCWAGLLLIGLSLALRSAGALFYVESLDGWSIPLWIGGAIWLFGGFRVFRWAAPAVAFLWLMIPLPYRAETFLSLPLQRIATGGSCWLMQTLALPALAEGNTILLDENRLEVAQACSGLRMFMAFLALCVAYVLIVQRPCWQKALVLASIVPIAITCNILRISTTGILYSHVGGEMARRFTHDFAGLAMMPVAAVLFWLLLWYMNRLVIEVETVPSRDLLERLGERRV